MKYLPSFYSIRKKILFIAFIAICFFLGAIKNLLAVETSCQQTLVVCQNSCKSRDGIYKFSCTGESFIVESERSRCVCGDSYESDINQQRINADYRRLKAIQFEATQQTKK